MPPPTIWNGKSWVVLSAEEWKLIISRILSAPPLNDMNKARLIRQLRNDKRDWEHLTSRNQDIGGESKLTIAELKRQIKEYHSLDLLRETGQIKTLLEILEHIGA